MLKIIKWIILFLLHALNSYEYWGCPANHQIGACLHGKNGNASTKHKSIPTKETSDAYGECLQYKDNSCCTAEFTQQLIGPDITIIDDGELGKFDWSTCGVLSDTCEAFFVDIECFYRCSPNIAYFSGDFISSLDKVPLCSSFCNDWYNACKTDTTCVKNWVFGDWNWTSGVNTCPDGSTCNTFESVYGDPQTLCNTLWGNSFQYTQDTQACLTPREASNNKAVVEYIFEDCNVNGTDYTDGLHNYWGCPKEHQLSACLHGPNGEASTKHKSTPTQETSDDYDVCLAYKNNSCCTAEFTQQLIGPNITIIDDGDAGKFDWSTCGVLSDECEAFFVDIECFYRCSPNIAFFSGDFISSLNKVPLCSSFCNDWFNACKFDRTCVANWVFGDWNWTSGVNTCPDGKTCEQFQDIYQNGTELCNILWGNSFEYTDNSQHCLAPNEIINNKAVVIEIFEECDTSIDIETSKGINIYLNSITYMFVLILYIILLYN